MSIAQSLAFCRISSILFTGLLLSAIPAMAQNASNIERDPGALTLIQRVVDASGGYASIEAVHDLVATGTLSAPMNAKDTTESPVTISLRGLDQLRIDSVQPKGARSIFLNRGVLTNKEEDGAVVPLGNQDVVSSISHILPLEHLAAALNDNSYSVTATDTVVDEDSGHNLYHFRLQRILSEPARTVRRTISSIALDYYVDVTTTSIVRVRNLHSDRGYTPIDRGKGPYEIYNFSDYQSVNGILLPQIITMSFDRQVVSTIKITHYQLNTGLTESNFTPAPKQ
jgi:hypothetical protein